MSELEEIEESHHTTTAQVPVQDTDGADDPFITSPYTTRGITVSIGARGAQYTVLQAIVEQYAGLKKRIDPLNPDTPVELREVDDDIGHTFIHYLYTGRYQTLSLGSLPDDVKTATEFKRSVLTYFAARLCGIEKLEELTKVKIEELSKELSVFDIQHVAEEVAPKFPRSGDWFSSQVDKWVKTALIANDNLLRDRRLYELVGRSTMFDRALVRSIAEMYMAKIEHVLPATTIKAPFEQEPAIGTASVTASHERADSVVQSDSSVQKHDKPQYSRNSIAVVTQNLDDAVTKASTDEYSPMPSEDPPESPFEIRQSNIDKDESHPPPVDTASKPVDSDGEAPKVTLSKKAKKKKRRAEAAATAPEQGD